MKTKSSVESIEKKLSVSSILKAAAKSICEAQKKTGEIPWAIGEKTDPWDMVEAVMGLNICGYFEESKKAFNWLKKMQLPDGSFYASYLNFAPHDKTRDTNMSSYIAVGALHYYLITKDIDFIKSIWNCIKKGIDFAISMQADTGEIYWAKSPEGKIDKMCLLTGSSSIYMSIKSALFLARELDEKKPLWEKGLLKLENALRTRRHVFNITKSRYSMDWFYPVLSGALKISDCEKRLEKHWKKFIVEDMGVRCVSENPWITIAETCELVLALFSIGKKRKAEIIYNWIIDRRYEDDGSFWCGFTYPDMVVWPEQKLTWTNGVAIMAADALYEITPASKLFSKSFWEKNNYWSDLN
ncbi:MAG: phenyltransferase domain-containing protein [Deltaproteobacteria bacterium]|nr:MAG: phenyltransferase domain-containing protein [Deltaproteobacteria bacterium]